VGLPIVTGGRIQANVRLAESQRDQLTLVYVWPPSEILTSQAGLPNAVTSRTRAHPKTVELIKNFHSLGWRAVQTPRTPKNGAPEATVRRAKAPKPTRGPRRKSGGRDPDAKSLMEHRPSRRSSGDPASPPYCPADGGTRKKISIITPSGRPGSTRSSMSGRWSS
jgi:hypothetical protein